MDLDSTLSSIDEVAVHHCGWCDGTLSPDGPSKYWCSDMCQAAWNEVQRMWQDTADRIREQLWPEWQPSFDPTELLTATWDVSIEKPEPPDDLLDGFEFGHPTTPSLVSDEPPLPVLPEVTPDVEAIQRLVSGSTAPDRSRRRIDSRGRGRT